MQMKANKAFFVIGGITGLVVLTMLGFLFLVGVHQIRLKQRKKMF